MRKTVNNRNRNKSKKGGLFYGRVCLFPSILNERYNQNVFAISWALHGPMDGYITSFVNDIYGGKACRKYNEYFLKAYAYAYDKMDLKELNDFFYSNRCETR
jgi:hypothetical protein